MRVLFQSFDPSRPVWNWAFERPRATKTAHRPSDVLPVLQWAESAAQQGRWVALAVGFEAASAVNPLFKKSKPSSFPLVWAAAFDAPSVPRPSVNKQWRVGPWRPGVDDRSYHRALRRIKQWIARGDTYQVNYTFPLSTRFQGDPETWFWKVAPAQGGAYSAYLDMGPWKVLSFSPELFFERDKDRLILLPMKGSAARGRWWSEDVVRARALAESPKDRAENLMIVDLLRNDAGKIARPGSVRTDQLFNVETYPTVFQMTSRVRARLRKGVTLPDLVTALFPSGSVTGAPKKRTLEIIDQLEKTPRGIYTGTIGLLEPSGRWTFNVAIRTIALDTRTGRARCSVGGGVTWDSSAVGERKEALLKAEFLGRPSDFSLLESLRLENGRYPLWRGHRDRLRRSAAYFGFSLSWAAVRVTLSQTARRHPSGVWKVRLVISRRGAVDTTAERLPKETQPWTLVLSPEPVDDRDVFLFHKTTHRNVYDHHRARCPEGDDVLLWNTRGEVTESTRANVVVEKGGRFYTPPRSSGLLGGVFRETLLREGRLEERVLRRKDVLNAERVFLINAVRGWIPVVWRGAKVGRGGSKGRSQRSVGNFHQSMGPGPGRGTERSGPPK